MKHDKTSQGVQLDKTAHKNDKTKWYTNHLKYQQAWRDD